MYCWKPLITALIITFMTASVYCQASDSAFILTGTIYNESFTPIAATHVINMNTRAGDVSDSLGIFRLPVHARRYPSFQKYSLPGDSPPGCRVHGTEVCNLKKNVLSTSGSQECSPGDRAMRIFPGQLLAHLLHRPLVSHLDSRDRTPTTFPLIWTRLNLKSVGFLLKSPISYLYYNLNKKEKNRRTLFWSEKNRESNERFDAIVSPESLSNITGLTGDLLVDFMAYLFQRMVCDFKCNEFKIYSEIYAHWEVYQQLHPELSPQ